MTLTQVRDSQSWKAAMELGPKIMRLAEDMPAAEATGLSLQLRQLMVNLPAAIAEDMLRGTDTRQTQILRLEAAVAMVDGTYPALDTAGVLAAVKQMAEQLLSDDFNAAPTPPAPAEPVVAAAIAAASTPVIPETATPVQADHLESSSPVLKIAVADSQESNVQPNSVQ